MAYRAQKVQKVMVQPINLIFRYLQNKSRVQVWLYGRGKMRIEGVIIGFDEFMNLVMDSAEEVIIKEQSRRPIGRILLRGDNITLIISNSTPLAPRAINRTMMTRSPQLISTTSMEPAITARKDFFPNKTTVQPFRRRLKRRSMPPSVPPLDLSRFNQPDELMVPVEILATAPACIHSEERLPETQAQKTAQMNLVEARMLSDERTKPYVLGTKLEVEIPHDSFTKCLKFEARIATQNGRDVHRELCGFFFLADGSLAIYEFRQFGKRSSALPLIQRGIYHHYKTKEQYMINYITKGATLYFNCPSHPSLPVSLTQKELLYIKITHVDEAMKRQLLCEGCNPVQCRKVEKYLSMPFPLIGFLEDKLLHTLQSMFRSRLLGRACKTLVGLGRQLCALSDHGTVSFLHLQSSLRNYHISLTIEDMQQLWQLLCQMDVFDESSHGVYSEFCLQTLTGALSEDQHCLIRQVFIRIDSHKSGQININQMKKFYITSKDDTLWSQMLDAFGLSDSVSFADFENFYHGLSVEAYPDSTFYTLMKTHWGI